MQITTATNFIYTTNNNEEWIIYEKADEAIKVLFESLLSRYQIGLETSMKGSDFTFDCVHIVIFKQDESYIGSPD